MQLSRADLIRYKGDLTTDADLADRIERLGPPIFLAPGAPIGAQIASMVVASNEEPMPGRPPIDPVQTEARGRAMWNAVLIEQAFDQVGETLAKLFGL
jgi:hypothetical protein